MSYLISGKIGCVTCCLETFASKRNPILFIKCSLLLAMLQYPRKFISLNNLIIFNIQYIATRQCIWLDQITSLSYHQRLCWYKLQCHQHVKAVKNTSRYCPESTKWLMESAWYFSYVLLCINIVDDHKLNTLRCYLKSLFPFMILWTL